MFQQNISEIFNDMPNVFGIADDTSGAGYNTNGKDCDDMVHRVLQRCREVNLKLNKEKCHFRCMSIPFFREVIWSNGVQPDSQKIRALMEMPPPQKKRAPGISGNYYLLRKILS